MDRELHSDNFTQFFENHELIHSLRHPLGKILKPNRRFVNSF